MKDETQKYYRLHFFSINGPLQGQYIVLDRHPKSWLDNNHWTTASWEPISKAEYEVVQQKLIENDPP